MVDSLLITGGAGFIGGNFTRAMAADPGLRLTVLDALTYAGNIANVADLVASGRVEFVAGDIRDRDLVDRLFAGNRIDAVVHFAAESHVDRSILGPGAFIETNVNGTLNLLQTARARWPAGSGRFLHVSTDEVYGSLTPAAPPFDERSPYAPNSPYAASKAASDHLVRAWHHTYGFPAIVTNCSNNYGPWQFPEKLVPLTILNAIDGALLPVYGDGLQVRDWLHVEDHCAALARVLADGRSGETYCVGGRNECTNLWLVQTICDLVDRRLGRPAGESRRLIRHVEDRPGHDRRYAIDSGKIERELGWSPRRDLQASLAELVDWYVAHRDWVDGIRSGAYRDYYARQYGARLQGAT